MALGGRDNTAGLWEWKIPADLLVKPSVAAYLKCPDSDFGPLRARAPAEGLLPPALSAPGAPKAPASSLTGRPVSEEAGAFGAPGALSAGGSKPSAGARARKGPKSESGHLRYAATLGFTRRSAGIFHSQRPAVLSRPPRAIDATDFARSEVRHQMAAA